MSETEHPAGSDSTTGEATDERVLRAKYADFCSAQLTEVFLSLSDERIYEIVQEEARDQDMAPGGLGFKAMVRLATKRLRDSVPLPDFDTWRREYESEPERYDPYLLGLWRQFAAEASDRDGAATGDGAATDDGTATGEGAAGGDDAGGGDDEADGGE